jgi:hypothetical protein
LIILVPLHFHLVRYALNTYPRTEYHPLELDRSVRVVLLPQAPVIVNRQ